MFPKIYEKYLAMANLFAFSLGLRDVVISKGENVIKADFHINHII